MRINHLLGFAVLVGVMAQGAYAQWGSSSWQATDKQFSQNDSAGHVKSIKASTNNTNDFAWYANFGKNSKGDKPEAFWLVVSPGPNPKGNNHELAIFYFDASKGQPKLTAYAYNGVNGDNSYKTPNDRIATSVNNTSWIKELVAKDNPDGTRTLGFRINPTSVNDHKPASQGWTGAHFGPKIGVWFHSASGVTTSYDQKGYLTKFEYCNQGWVDLENKGCVPEPASFVAAGIGFVGLMIRRKVAR